MLAIRYSNIFQILDIYIHQDSWKKEWRFTVYHKDSRYSNQDLKDLSLTLEEYGTMNEIVNELS